MSFVRAIPIPRKYRKPGIDKVEVIEYSLRSKLMPNGYWITLGALVIPSIKVIAFGASACAPEDAYKFDDNPTHAKHDAANRAMGRARQIGLRRFAGVIGP